jgi:hypothetical protein
MCKPCINSELQAIVAVHIHYSANEAMITIGQEKKKGKV